MHATLAKFGYPNSVVKDYNHWAVLVRPQQPTVGSLVLVCKEEAQALGDVSVAAFAEMKQAMADLEAGLKAAVDYQKINYMALMMVDKEVHFHVLPRYEGSKTLANITLADEGWPALPVLPSAQTLTSQQVENLRDELKKYW